MNRVVLLRAVHSILMSAGYVHSRAPFGLVISPSHHLCQLTLTRLWSLPPIAVTAATNSSGVFLIRIWHFISELCYWYDWLLRKWICNSKVVCRTNAYFTHDLRNVNPPMSSSKLNFINFEALLSLQMIYFCLKRMFLLFKHHRSKWVYSTFQSS